MGVAKKIQDSSKKQSQNSNWNNIQSSIFKEAKKAKQYNKYSNNLPFLGTQNLDKKNNLQKKKRNFGYKNSGGCSETNVININNFFNFFSDMNNITYNNNMLNFNSNNNNNNFINQIINNNLQINNNKNNNHNNNLFASATDSTINNNLASNSTNSNIGNNNIIFTIVVEFI